MKYLAFKERLVKKLVNQYISSYIICYGILEH